MKIKEKYKLSNILKILFFTFILLIIILVMHSNVKADTELFDDNKGDLWKRNST